MPTQYELVNKETGEIVPTTALEIGTGYVSFTLENGEVVRFENPLNDGNFENDTFAARQVDTHQTPNNDGIVTDEGVEIANE